MTTVKPGKIYTAIPAIMKGIKSIGKDRKNTQGWSFRGIDDMYNELHDLMAENGVFTVPEVLLDEVDRTETHVTKEYTDKNGYKKGGTRIIWRRLRVKYTIYADDGSFVTAIMEGEAMDMSDKGSNKAMSAAHKYLFIQIFSIPTNELDKDADFVTHELQADDILGNAAPKKEPEKKPEKKKDPEPQTGTMTKAQRKDLDFLFTSPLLTEDDVAKAKSYLESENSSKVAAGNLITKLNETVASRYASKENKKPEPAKEPEKEPGVDVEVQKLETAIQTFIRCSDDFAKDRLETVAKSRFKCRDPRELTEEQRDLLYEEINNGTFLPF